MKKLLLCFIASVTCLESFHEIQGQLAEIKDIPYEEVKSKSFLKCVVKSILTDFNVKTKVQTTLDFIPVLESCGKRRNKRDIDSRDIELLIDWIFDYFEYETGILNIPFPNTVQELDDRIADIIRNMIKS